MLLVGWQEGRPACKKTEWWGAGMVICLELSADLHTAQLMPLPFTVSCFSKIQIGFTFLVLAHLGSPGKRAIKRVCVYVRIIIIICQVVIQRLHSEARQGRAVQRRWEDAWPRADIRRLRHRAASTREGRVTDSQREGTSFYNVWIWAWRSSD